MWAMLLGAALAEPAIVEGWTADSRYFVYRDAWNAHTVGGNLLDEQLPFDEVAAAVFDSRTRTMERFILSREHIVPTEDDALYYDPATLGRWAKMNEENPKIVGDGQARWSRFQAAHPMAPPAGPPPKALLVSVKGKPAAKELSDATYDDEVTFSVLTPAGATRTIHIDTLGPDPSASAPSSWSGGGYHSYIEPEIQASPDGRFVAINDLDRPCPMSCTSPIRPTIVPLVLQIQVLAPAGAESRRESVVAAISASGSASWVGPAKKARDKSVVYHRPELKADAELIAKIIPGGADLAVLDWKTPAHLVVAVGNTVPAP